MRSVRHRGGGFSVIPDGLVKDSLQVSLGERGTLEVFMRLDILSSLQCFVVGNRLHSLFTEALHGVGVLPQIELRSDQNDRNVRRMVADFWPPLFVNYQSRCSPRALGASDKGEAAQGKRNLPTLARTLSNDGGLTIEKQIRKTSV